MSEIKYEIVKNLGQLSVSGKGWAKELNLVSWNDRAPNTICASGRPIKPAWAKALPSPPRKSSLCATC